MSKTAIILGATGLTGRTLLELLLPDPRYSCIKLFSRRACGVKHVKIEEHIVDLLSLDRYSQDFTADELYCCVGTTAAKTPDKDLYRKIDLGIPVSAAKMCKEQGVQTFLVVSAMGADAKSRINYNRLKGEMEALALAQGISQTYIVRPSLIGGKRTEGRSGEQIAKFFMTLLGPLMLGPLRNYRMISPKEIAKAMVWLANNPMEQQIFLSHELRAMAQRP